MGLRPLRLIDDRSDRKYILPRKGVFLGSIPELALTTVPLFRLVAACSIVMGALTDDTLTELPRFAPQMWVSRAGRSR
jgi:hypothetical protein